MCRANLFRTPPPRLDMKETLSVLGFECYLHGPGDEGLPVPGVWAKGLVCVPRQSSIFSSASGDTPG